MELSSTELFIEILFAGVLFTASFAPVLLLFPGLKRMPRRISGAATKENWPVLVVIVALVYVIGIAGNRASEMLYNSEFVHSRIGYPPKCLAPKKEADDRILKEFLVRKEEKKLGDWLERHKEYHKLLRAASISSIIFLFSLIIYFSAMRTRDPLQWGTLVFPLMLFVLFSVSISGERCNFDWIVDHILSS